MGRPPCRGERAKRFQKSIEYPTDKPKTQVIKKVIGGFGESHLQETHPLWDESVTTAQMLSQTDF